MRLDFRSVRDTPSYASVPAGVYECAVKEVRLTRARDGSERWALWLEVASGEMAGRTAAWDSITWSERGLTRVKTVLAALGYDVDGIVEVEPKDLEGRRARVQVVHEEFENPVTGERIERMAVPFLGWGPVEDGGAPGESPNGGADAGRVDAAVPTGHALARDGSSDPDTPF